MFCEGYVSKLITVKSKLHFVWGFYRFIILLLKKMTLKKKFSDTLNFKFGRDLKGQLV